VVYPWTPPLFGIPVPVLEKLERKLIEKLTEVTDVWIAALLTPTHDWDDSFLTSKGGLRTGI
jgi:hypothetical protein